MANFHEAVLKTLVNEGGYLNDPCDPGGETYRGVSRRNHANWSGWQIIDNYKNSPDFPRILDTDVPLQNMVEDVYAEGYWKTGYSQIDSQLIAEKLFDMGVLFGVGVAVRLLQATLNPTYGTEIDGSFGPDTLNAINQSEENSLLNSYKSALVAHILKVVMNKPQTNKFAAGWGKRVNS